MLKNKIKNIELEKSEFQINYDGNKEKSLNVNGSYKINDNLFQKFNFKQLEKFNSKKISIDVNFDDEIDIPILNYNSKNQVININTVLQIKKNKINFEKFNLSQGKNKINIENLNIENMNLIKFNDITVKTYKKNKVNNDLQISYGKTIKIKDRIMMLLI